ncbi:unnamed protein product [Brugia pahangi]|uniref:Uncharacterized protein n=1 Tax=Brugia pahangi TaxID=6280 RepID=A0A0N4T8H1_BRUPA|nr:unnamed protein product [Brugia pahangi]
MIQIIIISFFCSFFVLAENEKQLRGARNVRIYIPINGSQIIDFGFKIRNAIAFFPKNDKFNEQSMMIIRNGRLVREAVMKLFNSLFSLI